MGALGGGIDTEALGEVRPTVPNERRISSTAAAGRSLTFALACLILDNR